MRSFDLVASGPMTLPAIVTLLPAAATLVTSIRRASLSASEASEPTFAT